MAFSPQMLLFAATLLATCHLAAAQWEDCRTTTMVLTNGWRYSNLEITSYSRLTAGSSTLDCLNKCRADQDCYSFNYDKVKKWCYISLTEKSELATRRDGKFAAGYRKCVEHIDNGGWDNPEFNGGLEGTSPTGPATVTVAEDGTTNTVQVSWTPPSNPGTIDGTNLSVIMTYKIACSGVVSFSATVAGDATSYTNPTVFAYGGTETCTVQAINSAGLSSSTSGSVALTA